MARAPNEKINRAYELYKGGMKLVEIASQLDTPEGTVRSWKNRYKWDDENNATLQNKKRSVATKKKNVSTKNKEPIADEVKSVLENSELNDKQRLFCLYYIEDFNATKAYQKAYNCNYETAGRCGSRLLANVEIKAEVQRLTNECLKEEEINSKLLSKRLFQKYIDIAFANIGDFVEFGKEQVPVLSEFGIPLTDKNGEEITVLRNYVNFKNSNEIDGTIISEVSKGKDGVKIKLQDKMKAMDWLDKHIGLATEEQRARIDKLKADTNKINGINTDIEDLSEIDGEIYGD